MREQEKENVPPTQFFKKREEQGLFIYSKDFSPQFSLFYPPGRSKRGSGNEYDTLFKTQVRGQLILSRENKVVLE